MDIVELVLMPGIRFRLSHQNRCYRMEDVENPVLCLNHTNDLHQIYTAQSR